MRKYFLIILTVSFAFSLQAQEFGASLILGGNFSQVDGDQLGGYNKLGLQVGIGITRPVKDNWEASFELLFSQKGAKKVIDPDVFEPSLKLSYHYIEVPLLAKYNLNEKVQLFGGPSFGVNVFNEREDFGIISQEEALNKTEISLHLGASYKVTDKLALELRHGYSLLSVRDFPIIINGPTWFGRAGWYNRLFTVGARYVLR